jgi:membrane-associated tyrosine/threonine-specific cdc2-inhibitory kinase
LDQCFEICERLGEGSFGEVFQVRSRDDGKMYAIKKCRQPFRGMLDRQRKLAEVEKHERLTHHPNCVRFHKAWEERHKLYMQFELCLMR